MGETRTERALVAKDIAQALAIQRAYNRAPAKPSAIELTLQDPKDAEWRMRDCGCGSIRGEMKVERYTDGYEVRSWPQMRIRWCDEHTREIENERAAMRERLFGNG